MVDIIARDTAKRSDPIPAGVYAAVCTRVIDTGDQTRTWEGIERTRREVVISWEIPEITVDKDGAPMPAMISSKPYTLSLHERAALRHDLESWRGKLFTDAELAGFGLSKILGDGCMLQVIHNERGYADVSSIMALPKGTPAPKPATEMLFFTLDDPDCMTTFAKLPGFQQEKIKQSKQYKEKYSVVSAPADGYIQELFDDGGELPF